MIEEKVGFSFTKYNRINWKGEIIGYPKTFLEMPSYEQLTYNCTIGCLTVMIDREICKDLVFPDILKRQDHGLWLLLFKKGIQPYGINKVLASYRVRRNSVSSNKFVAAGYQWRLYRDIMNFKFSYSLIIMVKYLINGIRNRI
jgi:teichuronic acid biosynthesis glycosyltransferase TuaG